MIGWIWLTLILVSIVYAGFVPDGMKLIGEALFTSARSAVDLVFGLVGIMVFFLGLMRIAFDGGLRDAISRGLAPLTRKLFPDVPTDHPAIGAMVMNMASNMVGMGNAATPFGLKAMGELSKLNRNRGSATDAMVLFCAINTSAITILPPMGTIAVRAAAGSQDPWAIWVPTLIATTCSTVSAVLAYYLLKNLPMFRAKAIAGDIDLPSATIDLDAVEIPETREPGPPLSAFHVVLIFGFISLLLLALGIEGHRLIPEIGFGGMVKAVVQTWLLPMLVGSFLLIGVVGRTDVYASMIAGAKEGLQVAVTIVPYLVAILVAISMFRASGALDLVIGILDPITSRVGVPGEVLPMALLRPLSGSGAFAVMSETLNAHGPDSFIGMLTSTLMGSTETTFYVLALYLGAAGIVDGRHALLACLIGDIGGFVGAVAACHFFFG